MIQYAETLTFVIPFRYDSDMRIRNLDIVLDDLSSLGSKAIVLEADTVPHYKLPERHKHWVEYCFVEDGAALFYRTHYLNKLYRMVRTSVIGIWDTDMLVSHAQIEESLIAINRYGFKQSSPYDGRVMLIPERLSASFAEGPIDYSTEAFHDKCFMLVGRPTFGGALLVEKKAYLACGGENEAFKGWGPEDAERVHRMAIMGHELQRAQGCIYHLHHPRGANSMFWDTQSQITQQEEFFKICSMYPEELAQYISTHFSCI